MAIRPDFPGLLGLSQLRDEAAEESRRRDANAHEPMVDLERSAEESTEVSILDCDQKVESVERRMERVLVARLKSGDPRAFEEFVRTYQDRIFRLTFRFLGHRQEAEDIAQDVFLSVHRNIENYRHESRLYTWLFRIATNACKNRLKYLKGRAYHLRVGYDEGPARDESATRAPMSAGAASPEPSPESATAGQHLQSAIARELGNLAPEHRMLIVLRDIEGLPYDEICKITGLVEGTLKSRLHRARLALRERLASDL
jgi:RNA polymerase sigma-70 factor (ECF subfamily)